MTTEINGKAMVITEVLKQDGLFKALHIANGTLLPRQNVHYHLTQLVGEGLIEKQGQNYAVVEKEKLLDLLLASKDGNALKRGNKNAVHNTEFNELKQVIDVVTLLRALVLEQSMELKTHMANLLKEASDSLLAERKYLLEKVVSPGSARKQLRGKGNEEQFFKTISNAFEEQFGFEWVSSPDKRLNEFIDKMEEAE
jgi:hypothetical protein